MARLKKYIDRDGYYIHAAFRRSGRIYNVTYQITESGLDAIIAEKIYDCQRLPDALFHFLISTGRIYTRGAGVEGFENCTPVVSGHEELLKSSKGLPQTSPQALEIDQVFDPTSVPADLKRASEIHRYLKTRYPNVSGGMRTRWVNSILGIKKSSHEKLSSHSTTETIGELLQGRKLKEVQDHGTCIIIFCKPHREVKTE